MAGLLRGVARRPVLASRALSGAARRPVLVHEVSPRDGLQNESAVLSTDRKLELMHDLVKCSPASIEVSSFVRADVIPALADADDLCERLWQQPWALDARAAGMRFAGEALAGLERSGPPQPPRAAAHVGTGPYSA